MKKKLLTLLPEDEKAIAKIRADHPSVVSDMGAIRYALNLAKERQGYGRKVIPLQKTISKISDSQNQMLKVQAQTNILLAMIVKNDNQTIVDQHERRKSNGERQ